MQPVYRNPASKRVTIAAFALLVSVCHPILARGRISVQLGTTVGLTRLSGSVKGNHIAASEPLDVRFSFSPTSMPLGCVWVDVGLGAFEPHAVSSASRSRLLTTGRTVPTIETVEYGHSSPSPRLSLHTGIQLNSSTFAQKPLWVGKIVVGVGVETGSRTSEYTWTWDTPDHPGEVNRSSIRIRDFEYHLQLSVGVETYPWRRHADSHTWLKGISLELVYEIPIGYRIADDLYGTATHPKRIGLRVGTVITR